MNAAKLTKKQQQALDNVKANGLVEVCKEDVAIVKAYSALVDKGLLRMTGTTSTHIGYDLPVVRAVEKTVFYQVRSTMFDLDGKAIGNGCLEKTCTSHEEADEYAAKLNSKGINAYVCEV